MYFEVWFESCGRGFLLLFDLFYLCGYSAALQQGALCGLELRYQAFLLPVLYRFGEMSYILIENLEVSVPVLICVSIWTYICCKPRKFDFTFLLRSLSMTINNLRFAGQVWGQ